MPVSAVNSSGPTLVREIHPKFRDQTTITYSEKAREILKKVGILFLITTATGIVFGGGFVAVPMLLEHFAWADVLVGAGFGAIYGASLGAMGSTALAVASLGIIGILLGAKQLY